jgi:hypothetical protein
MVGSFVVQRVETVSMTDEQYEEAVDTLATLIRAERRCRGQW